jgi:hypothetical protein
MKERRAFRTLLERIRLERGRVPPLPFPIRLCSMIIRRVLTPLMRLGRWSMTSRRKLRCRLSLRLSHSPICHLHPHQCSYPISPPTSTIPNPSNSSPNPSNSSPNPSNSSPSPNPNPNSTSNPKPRLPPLPANISCQSKASRYRRPALKSWSQLETAASPLSLGRLATNLLRAGTVRFCIRGRKPRGFSIFSMFHNSSENISKGISRKIKEIYHDQKYTHFISLLSNPIIIQYLSKNIL